MNHAIYRLASFLLGLTAITLVTTGLSAQAETPDVVVIDAADLSNQHSTTTPTQSASQLAPITLSSDPAVINASITPAPEEFTQELDSQVEQASLSEPSENYESSTTAADEAVAAAPIPEAVPSQESTTQAAEDSAIAQRDIELGRGTRSGPSYIGIGANIGVGGDTAMGRGSFAVFSKIGLTRTLSLRPAALIGDDTAFVIPLTYDFQLRATDPFEPVTVAPYVGGGLVVTTDEDDNIGFAISGGVDVPISREFTATAGLNLGFIESTTNVGLLLGVGYNFR